MGETGKNQKSQGFIDLQDHKSRIPGAMDSRRNGLHMAKGLKKPLVCCDAAFLQPVFQFSAWRILALLFWEYHEMVMMIWFDLGDDSGGAWQAGLHSVEGTRLNWRQTSCCFCIILHPTRRPGSNSQSKTTNTCLFAMNCQNFHWLLVHLKKMGVMRVSGYR